jgi:hypothetical protein
MFNNKSNQIMKRVFSFLVISAFAASTFAQLYIGGELSFYTSKNKSKIGGNTSDGNSSYAFKISPEGYYYFSDNLAFGAGISYTHSGDKQASYTNNGYTLRNYKTINNEFSFSPFVRYDAISVSKVKIFLKAGLGVGFGNEKYKYDGGSTDGNKAFDFNIGIRPGIAYELNEKFEIDAILGYGLLFDHYVIKDPNDDKLITNSFGLGVATGLSFGLHYKL